MCYMARLLHLLILLVLTVPSEARTWRNADGKSIEAEFIKLENGVVHLKRSSKVYKIPLKTLSQDDQDFLAKKTEEEKEAAKPKQKPKAKLPINLNIKVSGSDLDDEVISGKPIVLHQWQAHCGACPPALAGFEKLAKRKKKRGAAFMIWHSADKLELAKSKSSQLGLKLPVYHGGMIKWDKKFGSFVWPHVVLINIQGEIVYMGAADRTFHKILKEQTP